MRKEFISDKQGIYLVALFIMGSTLLLGTAREAKKDAWVAFMLAMAVAVLLFLVYARLLYLFPGKNLFSVIQLGLGKFFGSILIILYTWFAFYLGALVLRDFGEFIVTVGLPETPKIIPMAALLILCIWLVREGIEVMGRWSELFLPLLILLIVSTTLLTIPRINLNNLRPFLYNGMTPVLKGAFSAFTFPFGDSVVFLFAFSVLKRKSSPIKVYLGGMLIAGTAILIITIRNIGVLGEDVLASAYFPSYLVARRINVGEFLQRLEIFVSVGFTVGGLIKVGMCLLVSSKGVAKLTGCKDYRFVVVPVGLLMIILSHILHESIMELTEWSAEVGPYYTFPFQAVLPGLTLIVLEIRRRSPAFRKKLKSLDSEEE